MVSLCFYFQVHQPYRLKPYQIFDIGQGKKYFDEAKNKAIMQKVAKKCYLPANKIMLNLIKKHPQFKISYSFSGTVLDQMKEYTPEVLQSFQELSDTKNVEILDETSHHSLSALHSQIEFESQVKAHRKQIKKIFGQEPNIFRNTELVYNNHIAKLAENMGYKGILAEGWDQYLQWRSPNFIYQPKGTKNIKLLLKNYKLSDDIAFRFSNKGWKEHPLMVGKYAQWVNAINGNGELVNLFMDYETFGEHQWEDTGIFSFLDNLPKEILKHPDNNFVTPSEAIKKYPTRGELDIHHPLSWADMERDLSAWNGNKMQQKALDALYKLEQEVKSVKNPKLLEEWRKLTTSDHFYYMCTKWFSDGDVHKYFNPYDSPYDAFITFMNVLEDLRKKLKIKVSV